MGRHRGSLRYMGPGGMESSLIGNILNIDLLSLWSYETVTSTDSIRSSRLLSGGAIII